MLQFLPSGFLFAVIMGAIILRGGLSVDNGFAIAFLSDDLSPKFWQTLRENDVSLVGEGPMRGSFIFFRQDDGLSGVLRDAGAKMTFNISTIRMCAEANAPVQLSSNHTTKEKLS